MSLLLETPVIGTALVAMATSWLIFTLIGPKVLRAIFPAYEKLNADKRILMNETFLSLCHGVVVGPLSCYVIAVDDDVTPDNTITYSAMTHNLYAVFFGYSVADLLLMLKYPSITNPGFLIHHMVSVYLGFFGILYSDLPWYCNVSLMMELSSPFTNMRVLLSELGLRKSRAYVINGVAMLVVFFLCRILPVPMYWYHMAQLVITGRLWDAHLPLAIGSTVGIAAYHVLNVIWFKKICVGVVQVINDMNE